MIEDAKEHVAEHISALEAKRLRVKTTVRKAWLICLSIVVTSVFLLFFTSVTSDIRVKIFGGLFCVIVFFIPISISLYMKGNLRDDFKRKVMRPFFNLLRPNITYYESRYVSRMDFESANLFNRPDRFSGEDLFEGKHEKTSFVFSEIHAEQKHQSRDKNGNTTTYYSTIFQGIFMVADFNKHIKSDTYVYSSGGKGWFSGYASVTLENPIFEKIFDTYSRDQIEARYILTPSLMERILNLRKKFNNDIYLSFIDAKVYIAIKSSRNNFDPDLKKEISMTQVERIMSEIDACISIIDELDLNTRIWTKK